MFGRLLNLGDIGRRYFVVNSFDGVLTVLGIVMGSLISGVKDPSIVFTSGLGASLALGISGFSSAYLSERAERERDLKEIEGKMLEKVEGSFREKKIGKKPLKISIVNGLSPFATGFLSVFPFALSIFGILSMNITYPLSIGISLLALLFLGYFLGSLSRRSKVISALKMLVVGIVTVVLLYLLGLGGV